MNKYESPKFVPLSDLEMQNVNGGGIPIAVFIVAGAVTVVGAVFIVAAGAVTQGLVGKTYIASATKVKVTYS